MVVPHRSRQTQRYFNVSSHFSRRDKKGVLKTLLKVVIGFRRTLYDDKIWQKTILLRDLTPESKQKWKKLNSLSKCQKGKYQNSDYAKWNHAKFSKKLILPLREKCPNTIFFLVRISQYLDWIQGNTKNLLILDTFQAVFLTLDTHFRTYPGLRNARKFGALCFLKTMILIFRYTGDIKHVIKPSQILKVQLPN